VAGNRQFGISDHAAALVCFALTGTLTGVPTAEGESTAKMFNDSDLRLFIEETGKIALEDEQ
jgi:hypothetical protein